MSFGGITGNGLASYVSTMLLQAQTKSTSSAETAATARANAPAAAALDTISHTRKSVAAQTTLATRQKQLTTDLQAALSKAGVTLKNELAFSLDAHGAVQVTGTKEDRDAFATVLNGDKTKPGFSQRVTELVQTADKLSASMRDSAAWVQAARSAGRNGNIADLYSTFVQTQDTTSAAYRIDTEGGSLSYPGILSSQA